MSASGVVHCARLRGAKIERQQLKFALVLGILALAINSVYFQEVVHRSVCCGSKCNSASTHNSYLLFLATKFTALTWPLATDTFLLPSRGRKIGNEPE